MSAPAARGLWVLPDEFRGRVYFSRTRASGWPGV